MEYNFQILTDGVSDLPYLWVKKHPYVSIVDTPINLVKDGQEAFTMTHMSADDFSKVADRIKQGYRAMTSQPQVYDPDCENPDSVETLAREYLNAGKDVIYITMNSSLSGTFSTASVLFDELAEEYQGRGRKILCVDSQCMSTGLALLMIDIAHKIENRELADIEAIAGFVARKRGYIGHFFTWGELSYVRRSGRVSAASAFVANIANIRLLCSAQYLPDGSRKLEHITPKRTTMIKLRGIHRFANVLATYAHRHIADPTGDIIVAHGNVPYEAAIITEHLKKVLPDANYLTGPEWRCGAGIQTHGGPTSIHVNFHTDNIGVLNETIAEAEQLVHELYRL